ncbi:MAG: RNA polymerase sigma factor [Spirochaetia bacterium]
MPGSAKLQRQTDDELIERVLRGETRFFAALVERYQDQVYGMAMRFVRGAADAEDVAQEAFLRAYRGLDRFKGGARFSTWLYRITWNLCADWVRKNRKPGRASLSLDDGAETADGKVDIEGGLLVAEERRRVRQALDGLPERYRNVLILMYYQKMPGTQIASVLDMPLKTVETRLYRARKLLRRGLRRGGVGGAG